MHWSQGLAQVAQALLARKKGKSAEGELQGIADSRKAVADAAMEKFRRNSAGGMQTLPGTGAQLDTLPDPEGAAIELMGTPGVPEGAKQAGMLQYQSGVRNKENAADRETRLQVAREATAAAAAKAEEDRNLRRDIADQNNQTRLDVAGMNAGLRRDLAAATAEKPPKAPPGYRYKEDGSMEPIPGGPADLKIKQGKEKELAAKQSVANVVDAEIANINKLIGPRTLDKNGQPVFKLHPGVKSAVGSVDVKFPTFLPDTADAEALIESLQSKASIDALRDIRAGGSQSVGQITEREWPRLESMKATLQMKQSDAQFPASLHEYREELLRLKKEAEAAAGADQPDDGWSDL